MISETQRQQRTRARAAAFPRSLRVIDVMNRDPVMVASWTRLENAERLAGSRSVHHLLVSDGDRLLGILCLCDLWRGEPGSVASEMMTAPPATIDPLASAEEAVATMNEQAIGCLPVLDGDRLVGIVTREDLRRAGALGDEHVRSCAACGTRHHVRTADLHNGIAFCVECLERGRAFDCDDPYDELGGGD